MTWNHLDSDMLVHVLTRCHFEMMTDPRQKDSFSTIVVPIDQRKWKDIPAVDYVGNGSFSFSVSKTMIRMQRHRGLHRQTDGAMQ